VNEDYPANDVLTHQMKQLLVQIEQEPVSAELRALAERLQTLLNEQRDTEKKHG
jgi:hypothetical protein